MVIRPFLQDIPLDSQTIQRGCCRASSSLSGGGLPPPPFLQDAVGEQFWGFLLTG